MEFSVNIQPDEDGYTGRECPQCERYFKIKFGTGLPNARDCHCPYCNHIGPQNEFWTKQQIEYARSIAVNRVTDDLIKQLKRLELKPDKKAFLSFGITVKGRPTPILYYTEKDLEERITCNNCTLEYTIYGTFGYCPDCGIHNSLQIANTNFDIIEKVLELATKADGKVKEKLIENALEDAVSVFDGFGRARCAALGCPASFQNIEAAQEKLIKNNRVDIASGLNANDWAFVCRQFQKRHLLAHKMGVMDKEYVRKTAQSPSLIGRKVTILETDVRELINHLRIVVENLFRGFTRI